MSSVSKIDLQGGSVVTPLLAEKAAQTVARQMPEPTGYHVLITIPEIKKKTDGGIIIPDEITGREHTASIVGFVLKLGPDAYADKKKFPSGPWCKEGDFVLFRSYSGSRVKINGQEFRFINDDTVVGVVADPRGVERAS